MDIEGVGKILEANHADNLRQFSLLRGDMQMCKRDCSQRYDSVNRKCDDVCKSVKANTITLTRIKTIGSLASLVWGAIVLFASQIVSELMGK